MLNISSLITTLDCIVLLHIILFIIIFFVVTKPTKYFNIWSDTNIVKRKTSNFNIKYDFFSLQKLLRFYRDDEIERSV